MRISGARRRPRARGFTTVEMLVALAVFLLVGTVAIAAFSGGDRSRLRAEAADIALSLQTARLTALESGRPVAVALDSDRGVLTTGTQTRAIRNGTEATAIPARAVIRPSGESEGLRLELRRGSERLAVELDWLTGKVRVVP